MSKRPYRLVITWQDRKWGHQLEKTAEEASSIRRAVNQALKKFFTEKSRRKERADAHASLTVSVQRVKRTAIRRQPAK
jgi:hypothetical protein